MPLPRVTVIPGDVWWLPGHGEAETRDAAECPVMPRTDTHNYPASPQNPCVGGGGGRPVQGQGPSQVILSLDYAVPCLLMSTLAITVHPGPRGNLPVGTSGGAEAMQHPRALTRRGVWTNHPPSAKCAEKKTTETSESYLQTNYFRKTRILGFLRDYADFQKKRKSPVGLQLCPFPEGVIRISL